MGVQVKICQVFMSDLGNLASDLDGSTAQTINFKLQLVESRETHKRWLQPQTKQNCFFQVCLHHRSCMHRSSQGQNERPYEDIQCWVETQHLQLVQVFQAVAYHTMVNVKLPKTKQCCLEWYIIIRICKFILCNVKHRFFPLCLKVIWKESRAAFLPSSPAQVPHECFSKKKYK